MIKDFIKLLDSSINAGTFIKLTLSNKKKPASDLNNVYVKPVIIKDELMLSFTYRHATKDITKNLLRSDALVEVENLLNDAFKQGLLATTIKDHQLLTNKKGNTIILHNEAATTKTPDLLHDKTKSRIVNTENSIWLAELGVLSKEGKVLHNMQDKYRQINQFVEIVNGIIKDANLPQSIKVADMGSGKGYLTFALYEYLTAKLAKDVEMTGVELRKELVEKCNNIATTAGFTGLTFREGSIEKAELVEVDLLIALHACDTATDEAIFKGIRANAGIILCSPCCHKQVRRDMMTEGLLSEVTQFGILAERQAEILTDTIRALILEAYGYKTNVSEFIATEHTPKNLIISAVKKRNISGNIPDASAMKKVDELRSLFHIKSHYLQELLQNYQTN